MGDETTITHMQTQLATSFDVVPLVLDFASQSNNVCFCLQVQLLISSQDVENYKMIKADLDRLRTLVEKSELWVEKKSTGGGDGKKEKKDKKEKGEVRRSNGPPAASSLTVVVESSDSGFRQTNWS